MDAISVDSYHVSITVNILNLVALPHLSSGFIPQRSNSRFRIEVNVNKFHNLQLVSELGYK